MIEVDFKDYDSICKKVSSILYSRSQRAGNTFLTRDDFYSDACLTFMRCKENYDSAHGASFKTYFIQALNMNYGMIMRKHFDLARATGVSLDQYVGDEETDSLHEVISDETDIEEQFSIQERTKRAVSRYPLAEKMLQLIINPPQDLLDELSAARAQKEYAVQLGVNMSRVPDNLSYTALSQIFQFNWRERQIMHDQLEAISGSIN